MDGLALIFDLLRRGEFAARYEGLIKLVPGPAGMLLLNYTDACQHGRRWDDVSILCRGLILRPETGEVVARPFPKFFNWGERDVVLPSGPFEVHEKVDGSLGISYFLDGAPRLATRGAFTSYEATHGTALLLALPGAGLLDERLTYLFEIIRADAGHGVTYDQDALVLLGVIARHTGVELSSAEVDDWALRLGCRRPQRYSFSSLDDVLAQKANLPANLEGFVIRFSDNFRVKLKGDAYLAMLRAALGVSMGKVLAALQDGEGAYQAWVDTLPEELVPDAQRMAQKLRDKAASYEAEARRAFAGAPAGLERKQFALWVQQQAPEHLRRVMFLLLDGKNPDWLRLVADE
jgi:RNA ligase